ncbi:hypothetical protein PHMEG_00019999 [Phytophthora megakarya]|uniref:Integrase catalytic domain-containing protein n=1 Tax=Phytophthora megakarya TaxID=4795 RepID=A0A225VSU2_9STRA|nr:hypothetical protein PHMEG_00019999 [Phytophthora megakarya]
MGRYAKRMKLAEAAAKHQRLLDDYSNFTLSTTRTKFEADQQASSELDVVLQMANDPYTDMFATIEPDESTLVLVFQRLSFVDDICFGGTIFGDCLDTLDKLLARFDECRISVSFTKSIFCQSKVDFLSHEVSPEGIRADPKKMAVITKLPFPNRFIQDFAVYGAAQLKEGDFFFEGGDFAAKEDGFTTLQRKVAETPILRYFDAKKEIHIMLYANEWVLNARRQIHPVRFCGRVLKDAEMNYHSVEKEILALSPLLKVCYTQLAGMTLHVYTRFSTLGWVHKSKALFGRAVQSAVLLSPCQLVVQRSTITNVVDLDDALALAAPPTNGSPTTRLDPSLRTLNYHTTMKGLWSAKTEKNGGYDSCSWIIVITASAYLVQTTVNMAEYSGMSHGMIAALEHDTEALVIVGHSRLAIHESLGLKSVRYLHVVREYNAADYSLAGVALESKVSKVVLNDNWKSELKELNRTQKYDIKVATTGSGTFVQILDGTTHCIHATDSDTLPQRKTFADFVRQESAEVSDTTRSQTKTKKRVHFEDEVPEGTTTAEATEADTENPEMHVQRPYAEVRYDPAADDFDLVAVTNVNDILRGETTAITCKEAREAWKWADNLVLSRDNLMYYTGLRLQKVLHNYDDSIDGGHQGVVRSYQRVKHDYFWIGPYADVEKHVESCLDRSSSKSFRNSKATHLGPFQVVSIDFVIPLPRSRRGNTALLLWQCSFTGFVIANAMSDTDALTVSNVFEECIYTQFGAPSLIRHNRDPRFMSEVFRAFAELIQARPRSTLSYRPQVNGQQERSVKPVMQSVKVYQGWDEIAERLVFAINNSHDMVREETPFYLVHRWDAPTTLRAMANDPYTDMFATIEPDESTLVLVFQRLSFVDDICFGGTIFGDCLDTLDKLLARFDECRISVSFTKSIFCQSKVDFLSLKAEFGSSEARIGLEAGSPIAWFLQSEAITKSIFCQSKVDFLSHEVSPEGIRADPKKMAVITKLPFPNRFIQDFAVYGAALYQLKEGDFFEGGDLAAAKEDGFTTLQRKVAETPILRYFDAKKEIHIMLYANEWVLNARRQIHPVRFCGRVLKDAEMNYHSVEKEILALSPLLKVCYTQLAGMTLHVYTRFSTLGWVHKSKALFGRAVQSAVLLSPCQLVVQRSTITNVVDLDDALALAAPPTNGSPTTRLDPSLRTLNYHTTMKGLWSAKTEKNGGYDSCSWIIVITASAYLVQTTVNMAEYSGMSHGMIAALEHDTEALVIVGHSRLAIHESLGLKSVRYLHVVREYNAADYSLAGVALESKVSKVVLNDNWKSELKELNRTQKYDIKVATTGSGTFVQILDGTTHCIHATDSDTLPQRKTFADFVRQESAEVSDTTRSQTKTKKRVHFEDEVPEGTTTAEATEADTENPEMHVQRPYAEVRYDPAADDFDLVAVTNVNDILRGETTAITCKEAREAWKWADNLVLSRDNLMYYTGLRLQKVLHNYDDSIDGGHQGVVRSYQRVKHDYFWIGPYADVEKHVESCLDRSSSKSFRNSKATHLGPFQVVSIDFVIPLPRSRRGNTALLLWQCSFTGFVIANAMSDTDALTVSNVFEECIYTQFGAPSLIRHNRDPRFMSEVFRAFAELIQARPRSTLSYRPQVNGQQERSVKPVMQSVKVYQGWDEIAERLVFAINNSHDMVREETSFYLVHRWDAHTTLRAMTTSLKRGVGKQTEA